MKRTSRQTNKADIVEHRYSNWLSQTINMLMPKYLYLVLGRGASKTTDIHVERIKEAAYDCPGAPFVWLASTYADLRKNIIPSIIDGLAKKGWQEGLHYVIDSRPPQSWIERMYVRRTSFKDVLTSYTGTTFTFASQDRASIGAGSSYVGFFCDEAKYLKENIVSNLLKAVRGYREKYGDSPFYRSQTMTTDMPNPNNIGEYDWILKMAAKNDKQKIMLLYKCAIVYNDTKKELANAIVEGDKRKIELCSRKCSRWEERFNKLRSRTSLFLIASAYVNVDILSIEYFQEIIDSGLEGIETSVLSIIPKLKANQKFYVNLSEKHFYEDGNDNEYVASLPYGSDYDCRLLKYLNKGEYLEAGLDVGKTLWLVIGQKGKHKGKDCYRLLKEFYSLPPKYIRDIADEFIRFMSPHKTKVLRLYYDRSANNYRKVGADVASQIKQAIEFNADGSRTGWSVILMSVGQGNIGSNLEYNFMTQWLGGILKLPLLLIDKFNCPNLKSQLENCRTKKVSSYLTNKEIIVKEKKTDYSLPDARLVKESTNFTDAFKYLVCRKEWLLFLPKS